MTQGGNILRFSEHKDPGGVTWHLGLTLSGLPVQLLFWGNWWTSADGATRRATLESQIQTLLAGPYTASLDQYWISPPTFRGSLIITDPQPPAGYTSADSMDRLWDLIEGGAFPEPDDDSGRIGYFVFYPQGTNYQGPGSGIHSKAGHFDPPFDIDYAFVATIPYGDVPTTTATFSHELVEMLTDPEDTGFYCDAIGHDGGEIGDLCQPNGNQETAYVDGVQVVAYWSNRDNCCIIPAGPFAARIDGTISVVETKLDQEGDQEDLFDPYLCRRFPAVCCLHGPYHWQSFLTSERGVLIATATGYQTPAFSWFVNNQPLNGTGTINLQVDVVRQTAQGAVEDTEQVTLAFSANAQTLNLTNTLPGTFTVSVSVEAVDTAVSPASGQPGTKRTAQVPIPFSGQIFQWDDVYKRDLNRCMGAAINDYLKHRELLIERRPGLLDPGPLREVDQEILVSLPAAVPIETRHQVRLILVMTSDMAKHDAKLAAGIRAGLLAELGVPVLS
jgi:hypothetical protein